MRQPTCIGRHPCPSSDRNSCNTDVGEQRDSPCSTLDIAGAYAPGHFNDQINPRSVLINEPLELEELPPFPIQHSSEASPSFPEWP